MSYKHRQQVTQLSLIVFCCLFVAVTRTEVAVNSQEVCLLGHFGPPPKYSWYPGAQVAVRIDDAWVNGQ